MQDILDVIVVGAGLSGIGTACHLRSACPDKRLLILESRERSGGTWDLFRYPGIRSDSDMHTLGYNFKPWEDEKAIADGPSILHYLRETARERGIDQFIRYEQQLQAANWSSSRQCWELSVRDGPSGETRQLYSRFLMMCAGYYNYQRGHQPDFPGRDDFAGTFVHPQFWPESLDYRNKRVLVIGSGATAMTLLPALAEEAKEVLMLQRSPTWVVSRPARDRLANLLRAILPLDLAYRITRWKNTRLQEWVYQRSRKQPQKMREMLLKRTAKELAGSADIADFTPRYDPWDQRLCLVPDSDLFKSLRAGKAQVITGEIDHLTKSGVRLRDGTELNADIIVSATGLELEIMGGVAFSVDGQDFDFPASWSYRGMMYSGLPNLVTIFGYINASWTLRSDIVGEWFCRLLQHMDRKGHRVVVPQPSVEEANSMQPRPWIEGFSAGYMQRLIHLFPRQGDRSPWINSQDYRREKSEFTAMSMDEAALHYPHSEAVEP